MSVESCIVSGPKEGYNIPPDESLGQYLLNCLKKRDRNDIVNIDGVTGEAQTCGRLLEDAVRATYAFKSLGLEKGDVISIISENRIGYNVPILAAFCMGFVVNPLNAAATAGELLHCLSISKPKLIICSSSAISTAKQIKNDLDFVPILLTIGNQNGLEQDTESFEALLESTIVSNYDSFQPQKLDISEDVALILMSSGTTGLPKGVMLTHRTMRLTMGYVRDPRYMGIGPGDSILILLPILHIFGMMLYLSAICTPIQAVTLKKFHPKTYLEILEKYKTTKLHLVPTLVQFLIQSDTVQNYNLTSVDSIAISAAPSSGGSIMELKKRFPKAIVMEAYGLTEAAGACTFLRKFPKKPNCVGQLIPSLQAKIWDQASSKTLKSMEIGEICLRGPMIMKGYVGVANTSSIIDEEGFYHTGDLGYYDEEGYMYIVDRIKELIKYKGFQVSPAQIELILLTHPDIEDCAVLGILDEKCDELPTACVVRKTNSQVTEKEIVDFVAEKASDVNRLHGGVIFVDTIPKNPSGKILRRKLRELYQASAKNNL